MHRVGAMMNDGCVHHGWMRHGDGCHSYYAWMRIDLGGGEGGEHKELFRSRKTKVNYDYTPLHPPQYSQL